MASFPTHSSFPDSQETTHAAEETSIIAMHEQMDHFTGINDTNNSTAMASFPTHSSFPDSPETTLTEDSQQAEKSTQRLQTTRQKITESSEATEQHFPDFTTFTINVSSKAAEETSTIAMHEQMDHFTGINDTNNSTAMASFPTHSSFPDSPETTLTEDSQQAEKSTQRLQTTRQKITESSEATEQHFPDFTTFTINVSSKAAEETSSIAIHEQMDHFTGINDTNNSTAMASFPTDLLPDSQETTHAGELVERFQTTKAKITEPDQATEEQNPDSTTFKIPTIAAEETSTIAMHEQMDHFTGINDTNNSTAMASFPTHSSFPDSQETTQTEDSQQAEKSTQRLQTTKQKITESSEATEQHFPDFTTFTINVSSKAAEEPSSITIDEQFNHFTNINGTNNSTAMASFPTDLLPDSQETTQSRYLQLAEEPTQHFQTTIQKIAEPSEVTEQHILYSTTFKIPSAAAEEPSSIAIHEQMDHFTGINDTNNSTAMASFPTQSSLPGSQETTHLGDSQQAEESTQRLQTTMQKITKPSEVTEQHIPDSTIFTINISSKAAEEPSPITIDEQFDHFTSINGTNNSTAMPSFPTDLLPDSQEITHAGELVERFQTTKEKITEPDQAIEEQNPDSTTFKIPTIAAEETSTIAIHEQMDHFTGINDTNNSTAMASFPTHSSFPDSQETTLTEDSQQAEKLTQRLQTAIQKITESSEATEQHFPDFTTFTINVSSKAAEEPSSITIDEQFNHFTGINDTNNSTAMASFPTQSSLPGSQETTHLGDSQLAEESTQRLQTAIQNITESSEATEHHIPDSTIFTINISSKAAEEHSSITIDEQFDHFTNINSTNNSTAMPSFPTDLLPDSQEITHAGELTEPDQAIEEQNPDSTTFKIPTIAEETSTIAIHEQMDHFTGINDTNNSTAMASFPTHSSFPDSQETTQTEDSQQAEESTQLLLTTKQKITEPSEVTDQHIPDSINGTNNSTAMPSFPTDLLPDSQEITNSGDPQLVKRFQTTKQKITEPDQAIEEKNPDSTTFKIPTITAKEPSTIAIHEQIDHFTGVNGTNNSTTMESFPTHSPLPDSQETTQSENSQLAEESTQRLQTTKLKIAEPSEVTDQHILDSTTFTIKISKAAEEPSSITIHEQIDNFTVINGTNNSTIMVSFPTDSLSNSQETTQSGDLELPEQPTQHLQTTKQKIAEPSQVTEQHFPDSTTFTIKVSSKAAEESSSITIHEQIDNFPVINGINNSTIMVSFPTDSLSDSQETTQSGDLELPEEPTQHFQTTIQKIGEPSEVTEEPILDSTTFTVQDSASPSSDLSESTSDPKHHKRKPTEEPTNKHTEKNTTNTAKSSRDSFMQPFMTSSTHILTDTLASSKTASTSPLPILVENHLVDSKGPKDTSVPTTITLQDSTSFITYQSNAKTQSQRTTNKYTIFSKMMSHTSFPLVKDTSTQAPKNRVQSSQTTPVSNIMMFTPNPKPSEKHIPTTSVMQHGFLTSTTQEIPSWISTKPSNIQPTETAEPSLDQSNQGPTADPMPKENSTNNNLLIKIDKPTESKSGRKPIILLREVHRRWQAWQWRNNMWVAGSPQLPGTYSVLQVCSSYTAIQMRKKGSQKKKEEKSDVHENIVLSQQHIDLV
ncbi:Dihydroorotate dehydrogenase (quinone) [Labeo rohita]|uniref:Dihydroorotate dehydrogenase (Quinone) n=1 Tax=Labeo rohita TaxID=84645 RepID=A0ABQ8MA97_LABRO|nr:Dihydroorotate dehydrogenase (quinone) [Labeo rohita]